MDMLTNSQAVGFADVQEYCRHGRAATASPVDYSDGANVIGM
jgi:hypothetical protein